MDGLLSNHKVSPAVSPPATIATFTTKRLLFAIAYHMQPVFRDTQRSQILFGGGGPTLTQCQVVVICPSFVAMPLNLNFDAGMLLEEIRILLQDTLGTRIQVIFIELKMNVLQLGSGLERK